MERLRRKGILATWVSFCSFFATFLFVFLKVLTSLGFPNANINMNGIAKVVSVAVAATNFPDVLSIIVYIKLWLHFWKKNNDVDPSMVPEEQLPQNHQVEENSGVFPVEVGPAQPENDRHFSTPPNKNGGSTSVTENQATKTLRILRYHVLTSLMDLTFSVLPQIPNLAVKRIVSYHISVIITFWIPLWVIKKNFKQMDNMVDSCCRIIC